MSTWFATLPATSQAVLIGALAGALFGAVGTIVSGFLRDFLAAWLTERRAQTRAADDVFRMYAEPLAASATSLFWRLREMFEEPGRATFLIGRQTQSQYHQYKLWSTYYRLGALLGWITGLKRELSFLRLADKRRIDQIDEALDGFERSLADGHHVEIQCLAGLLDLWEFRALIDDNLRFSIAVDVENHLNKRLLDSSVARASELNAENRKLLCIQIAELIRARTQVDLSDHIVSRTVDEAIRQLCIRRAWLYRDWQTAIGATMLMPAKVGRRAFEVKDYGQFESMLLSPSPEEFRSISRIDKLFYDVDFEAVDPYDARKGTIDALFIATANLVLAIHATPASAPLINEPTVRAAEHLLDQRGLLGR